jgi:hypothetical protein
MTNKKVFVALLIIVVATVGFVAGLYLLQDEQDIRDEAAVPGGQATVSISPSTGNYQVGDVIESSVHFNPSNIAISGVAVRLKYPFSGSTPEVTVESIDINPVLLSSGNWTCPTKNSTLQAGEVVIEIACANTSAAGFTANSDILLAQIDLKVTRTPQSLPFTIRFDPSASIIAQHSNNQDILLIPTSTGSYTIGGAGATTPTPTSAVGTSPTPTLAAGQATATPLVTATPTPTEVPKGGLGDVTGTVTPTGGLPDTGMSFPTLIGVGFGILVIAGSLLLAF